MATTALRPAPVPVRGNAGFWLVGAAYLVAMAFTTVPTPLYPIYARVAGFSTFTVTVIFSAYAAGVIVSLFLAGHLSDWLGRRRVLVPALVLEVAAAGVFVVAPGVPGLLAARFLTGIGVGMITATATAYLSELNTGRTARFELVTTAANVVGLGVGPLVAGLLAEYAPGPLTTPYLLFAALLVLAAVAVSRTRETVAPVRRPYRPQRFTLGNGGRRLALGSLASGFAAFAVFGMFASLAPTFIAGTLHHRSPTVAGLVLFAVFAVSAAGQSAARWISPGTRLPVSLGVAALGLAVIATGIGHESLPLFVAGSSLAGAGAALLLRTAVWTVVTNTRPAERGEALATLFLCGYLGLILPAVGLGIALRFVPAPTAVLWFGAGLVALLAGVGALAAAPRASATACGA